MYSHPRDTSTYGKNGFQLLLTTLTVYNDRGCKGYFEKRDTICPPNALFETDTTMGCAPLAVEFTSQSTSCDDIVSWTYVWGDGTENTFLDEGPHTHTYNQDGDFLAYLIVVNERGCRDTSYEIPIEVGVPIDPDFNMDLNTICTGDTLRVSDITGDPRIDAWHFTADGARLEQCPGEPNTNLVFVDASGQIEINLEVIYNGCPASNSQTHTIDVSGPQARYAYSIDCASPMQVSFVDSSIDTTNVIWYFGDGDSSLMNNPTHTYAATGDYEVILKAENSTNICVESRDTFMVHIRQIEAQFELPEEGCSGTPLMLDATMSTDVTAECWKGYTWFTSESRPITTQDSVIDFSFGNEGKQWARLVVEDINGCRDTISDTITIFRVVADFTISDDTICSGQTPPVSFTDLSQSLETGNIVEWEWSFGDGSMSTNQNPTYNFPTPPLSGVFQVTLTAKNDKNCPGEITKEIFVYEPFTEIMIPDQDLCVGEEITFSAADFTDYGSFLNYSWSLNGTPLTTSNSGTQQFNTAGTFTLNLTYTEDATGCVGTDSKSIDVQDYPDASFFAESNGVSFDSINCANQNINFTTNNFTSGVSYSWQADGKNFPEIGSGFTYSFNQGTFSVTSIASTTFGCRDTFTDVFTFIGPEGDLELSNSQICAGESVELSLNNQNNVSSFILISGFMGQSSTTSPATFTYPQGGLYGATVEMTYVGMGLNCRAIDTAFVEVIEPNGVLSPLALSYCIGQSVNFSLDSISDADFFYFNFGDGSPTVSTGQTLAEHNYTQPGTYTVEIILEDTETGCTKTIETEVTIEAQKIPVVVAPGSVCGNNEVIFIVNNYIPGERFIWTDPDGNLGSDPDTLGQNLVYTFPAISRNSDYKLNFSTGDCDFDTTFTVEYLDGIGLEGDSLVVLVAEKDEMDFNGTPIPGLPANAANYNIVWTPNRSLDVNDPLNPILTQLPADSLVVVANVTDDAGCDSARFVRLLLVYRIPNVFYPGSAEFEENRVFNVTTVSGLSGSEVLSMRIYNTWGKLVYDNDDPVNGWDGTKDGVDQPSDVYMYQIELQLSDGTKRIIEGDVTLLR
ncbi:MAG: PKD domain-containing protein [Saprospiraceae bacterium]